MLLIVISSKYFFSGSQDKDCELDTVPPSMMHPRFPDSLHKNAPSNLISILSNILLKKKHVKEGSLKVGKEIFSVSAKYGNL